MPQSINIRIDSIKIGKQVREDLGDIKALAESIKTLGLLSPVGITETKELAFGLRRIEACKLLGMTHIDACVIFGMDDLKLAMANEHENTKRKNFTRAEGLAAGRRVEELLKPAAKEAEAAGRATTSKKPQKNGVRNLRTPKNKANMIANKTGRRSEAGAKRAGMGTRSYEKAKEIIAEAEILIGKEIYADLAERVQKDDEKVDPLHKEFKARQAIVLAVADNPDRYGVVLDKWIKDRDTVAATKELERLKATEAADRAADPVGQMADAAAEYTSAINLFVRQLDELHQTAKGLESHPLSKCVHWHSIIDQLKAARGAASIGRPKFKCPYCKATGHKDDRKCRACDGQGWVHKTTYKSGCAAVGCPDESDWADE